MSGGESSVSAVLLNKTPRGQWDMVPFASTSASSDEVCDVSQAYRYHDDGTKGAVLSQPRAVRWSNLARSPRIACQPFARCGRQLGAALPSIPTLSLIRSDVARDVRQGSVSDRRVLIDQEPVPSRETHGQQNADRCVASGRNPGRRRQR
jgi:hypothetical protein